MSGIGDKRARNEGRRFFIQGLLSLQGSVPAVFLSCCYKGLSLPCPKTENKKTEELK
jgi:hypothetical protein